MKAKTLISVLAVVVVMIFGSNTYAQHFPVIVKGDTGIAVTLAGATHGEVDRYTLFNNDSLVVVDLKMQVVKELNISSFSFTTIRNGDLLMQKIQGNKLDDKIKKILRTMPAGAKFWIEDIFVTNASGDSWKIPSGSFKLK